MESLEALGENKKIAVYYTAPLLATYQDRIIHNSATAKKWTTNLGPEQWLRQITPASQSWAC